MDSKRFTRRLVALGAAMFLCALVFVITLFDALSERPAAEKYLS